MEEKFKEIVRSLFERQKEVEILLKGTEAVLEQKNFPETARLIFDYCCELLGATSGYVALLNEQGDENEVLFLEAGGLPCTVDPDLPMPIRGLRAEAYKECRSVYDNNFSRSEWMKYMPEGHVELRNVMFAPLVIDGKAVGLLGLANKKGGFTDRDSYIAKAFGELAAIALKNSMTLEALKEGEAFFRDISCSMADWIWEVDKDWKYVYSYGKLNEILGYSHSEIKGKTPFDLMPQNKRDEFKEIFKKASLNKKNIIDMENIKLSKGNKRKNLLTSGVPVFNKEGDFSGYRGVDKDITAQKELEESLREAAKMEALGRLAGGFAHHFNNIMAGIMGYIELSLDDLPPGSEIEDNLKYSLRALNRGRDLVKQILLFTSKDIERKEKIKISSFLKKNLDLIKDELPSNVELKTHIKDTSAIIFAPPPQIQQLLINLSSNSFLAMSEGGGTLEIALDEIELPRKDYTFLKNLKAGIYIKITVKDNGCGMSPEVVKKVFDPYFTTRDVGKGTGMGLAVVYGIVRGCEGDIDVQSAPGKGTVFNIYLPVAED